eukprot:gnl/Spiro4/11263_TR5930_c0_g1_i1.p1 gnl/Spiro4/11263_TR5930_c0_g1~~gnl/Spiro4/11263_TR5930_c0_g1_i1.p1  ORF type:complete len:241 (+),score=52.62 gnl/Spiro4/11263_TR5930_c0_g1_i1:64-723(+)
MRDLEFVLSSPAGQIGMQYGAMAIDTGSRYIKNGSTWAPTESLAGYAAQPEVSRRPVDDLTAPDLYIPTMAFVTYVLVVCFVLGYEGRFDPEHLGITASTAIFALLAETLFVKLGLYLTNARQLAFWPGLAHSGYKFVGLVVSCVVGIAFGEVAYYGAMVFTAVSMGLLLRSSIQLPPEQTDGLITYDTLQPSSGTRIFATLVGVAQLPVFYLLGFTRI